MKDIYELLNGANIDADEFEEMDATELEKAKLKSALKKKISRRKKGTGWKANAAAASVMLCLSAAVLGSAFPAYASGIPVVGDIFRFFDNGKTGIYDNYKEHSTALNLTEESGGVKVTIDDAVFDGDTVSLTFTLESERDLGENPFTQGAPKLEGSQGTSGLSKITKVGENRYVGLYQATDLTKSSNGAVGITWNLDSIVMPDKQERIKGDWGFAFSLNATDGGSIESGQSAEQNGVRVNVEKIAFAPMSFTLYYDQEVSEFVRSMWHGVDIELDVKDDLGNNYTGQINGGTGEDFYNISRSVTFGKLNPNAAKLIVTPRVVLTSHNPDNYASVEITEIGTREIPVPSKLGKGEEEFSLADIVIELKK